MLNFVILLAVLLFCLGCTDQNQNAIENQTVWHVITGRDDGTDAPKPIIYRVKVPLVWERNTPLSTESIVDSTKPLCEYLIKDGERTIRLTIHNFPTEDFEDRVPPAAQVARWKQQLETLDPATLIIQPISYGGFAGLYFEGASQDIKMMGWSMQLSAEHYRNLFSYDPAKQNTYRQLRSDYTIKAVGPRELMEKSKSNIIKFAKSFELIEEIPARP